MHTCLLLPRQWVKSSVTRKSMQTMQTRQEAHSTTSTTRVAGVSLPLFPKRGLSGAQ